MKTYTLPGNFAKKKEFLDHCRNVAQKEWNDELHNQGFARQPTTLTYDEIIDAAKTNTSATWFCNKRAIFRVEEYWEVGVEVYERKLKTRFFVWIHVPFDKLNESVFQKFGVTIKNF